MSEGNTSQRKRVALTRAYSDRDSPHARSIVGGYGAYGSTPAYANTQSAAYGSSAGSNSDGRASKRPRIDTDEDGDTPTRSSGSWAPITNGQTEHGRSQPSGGLALPPMPHAPAPANSYAQQSVQENGSSGSHQSQTSEITSLLENQVRGLAGYDGGNVRHSSDDAPRPQPQPQTIQDAHSDQTESGHAPRKQRERGAKEGQTLSLSCMMCMQKNRKCAKDFPCSQCVVFGVECVPSVRKTKPSAVAANKDQSDQPQDEESEDISAAPEADADDDPDKRVVRDHTDSKGKYLFKMPRVIDGYQQWDNMPLPYHPFPANLDNIRDIIFKLEKPLLLNSQQYADYWPHVSNVYARSTGAWRDANGVQIEV